MGIGNNIGNPPNNVLKVTNYYEFYGDEADKRKSKAINIIGNCTISNWDTENYKENTYQAGYKQVFVNQSGINVKNHLEYPQAWRDTNPDGKNQINFKQAKFSVFTALAQMDDHPEDLTIDDLRNAKQNLSAFKSKCNNLVENVEYDEQSGKAKIKMKNNEAFTIDFESEAEKKATALHDQIYGWSLNKNTVAILGSIDKKDMAYVVKQYGETNKNSLAKDIKREWGLDLNSCKLYICKKLLEQADALNIKDITFSGANGYNEIDNLKDLEKWIDDASKKIIDKMENK